MTWARLAWVVGGYLAGTFPSAYVVLQARRASDVIRLAKRRTSEGDAHILIRDHVGGGWSALAMTMDVAKGFVAALLAATVGDLPSSWLAGVGIAIVAGHSFPPYARSLAGRGLAAAAGVYLALLPVEMAVAGIVTVLGIMIRWTPVASTVGFASVPAVAAVRGSPAALVAMGVAILVLILLRRLEGIRDVATRTSWPRALYYRLVHDASGPPQAGRPLRRGTGVGGGGSG